MQQVTDRLAVKLQGLSPRQLAEVEQFVEALQVWDNDSQLRSAATSLSGPSFASIWQNPEDDAYDAL